ERYAPTVLRAVQLGMQVEIVGKREQLLIERLESFPRRLRPLPLGEGRGEGCRFRRSALTPGFVAAPHRGGEGSHALANPLELIQAGLEEGFGIALADHTTPHQVGRKVFADGRLPLYGGVDARLCERRVVTLVVAPSAVPDQIDEEILPKLRAVRRRH